MNPIELLATKIDIRKADPRAYIQNRMGENAAHLSRAGEQAARVERANEALCRLVELLYQADTDGTPANIDPVTHRILIPAPWGSRGWRAWGLRHWEAGRLRAILIRRCTARQQGQRAPLFDFNSQANTWHLSLADYPVIESALFYLERKPITLAEWKGSH
jgi:hypothetical protein